MYVWSSPTISQCKNLESSNCSTTILINGCTPKSKIALRKASGCSFRHLEAGTPHSSPVVPAANSSQFRKNECKNNVETTAFLLRLLQPFSESCSNKHFRGFPGMLKQKAFFWKSECKMKRVINGCFWYISGIYCQLGDYMPPTTFYGNQKQPLMLRASWLPAWYICYES